MLEAAVAVDNQSGGRKRLVAYVAPKQGSTFDADGLREFLRPLIPGAMIPNSFFEIKALPRTIGGKIDRRNLSATPLKMAERAYTHVAPRDDLEKRLIETWEDFLGVEPIGIRDDFFELGGDSLLAVRLFARIKSMLGKELAPSILLRVQRSRRWLRAFVLKRLGFPPRIAPTP